MNHLKSDHRSQRPPFAPRIDRLNLIEWKTILGRRVRRSGDPGSYDGSYELIATWNKQADHGVA
jgi:hypothetical protein